MKKRVGVALTATIGLALVAVTVGFASLPGKGHEAGKCQGNCGEFCDDGCGHGADKAKVTKAASSSKTSLVSLKGEGHEAGKCPGKCGPEGRRGCDDGCGHGADKGKVTKAASSKKTEAATSTAVPRVTNVQ